MPGNGLLLKSLTMEYEFKKYGKFIVMMFKTNRQLN